MVGPPPYQVPTTRPCSRPSRTGSFRTTATGRLHLSEFFGQCTTQLAQYLSNLANRLADVLQKITELAVEYGDHTGLPQGKWPQAVNG